MCFSTSASFSAGLVLSIIGTGAVKKARTPRQVFFACIPLIFCVQQISEGFVWLSLSDTSYSFIEKPATYFFLFIAQVIWPFYVPLSISLLEEKDSRKKSLKLLIIIGALISAYLGFCLLSYHVKASIQGFHISYTQNYPSSLSNYGGLLYILATVLPPFISSVKRMFYLGAAILISYIITKIFYTDYIVSVWCFFASVISITVFIIIPENRKKHKLGFS